MSNQALTWAFERDGLPCKAKFVLVSLANHADHTNGYCWLKIETISQETGIPVRSLFRYIGALIRNGYIRREKKRGADGKQRANDYWLLMTRTDAPWDWGAVAGSDDDAEAQDVVEPDATVAVGENDLAVGEDGADVHDLAPGPTAIGGTDKDSDEPPKTNPEKKEDAPPHAKPPRGYKPPPVAPEQPQGALHPDARKPIFAYMGTPAWDAWVKHGHSSSLHTTITIDGQRRTGWSFPTLFPPGFTREKESAEVGTGTDPPHKKTA